jgi:hypothetical protein
MHTAKYYLKARKFAREIFGILTWSIVLNLLTAVSLYPPLVLVLCILSETFCLENLATILFVKQQFAVIDTILKTEISALLEL